MENNEDVTIQQITLLQVMPFNQDFVASLSYSFGKDYSYYTLLFKQSSQTKEIQIKRGWFWHKFMVRKLYHKQRLLLLVVW